MKGENTSAAEWLRGIIDECEVDRMRRCTDIAEAFGIDCKHEKSCRDCITRMMTAIADRIDAERALPDGMEWPRFEDGELVKVGDEVEYKGETMRVYLATFDAAVWACVLALPALRRVQLQVGGHGLLRRDTGALLRQLRSGGK